MGIVAVMGIWWIQKICAFTDRLRFYIEGHVELHF